MQTEPCPRCKAELASIPAGEPCPRCGAPRVGASPAVEVAGSPIYMSMSMSTGVVTLVNEALAELEAMSPDAARRAVQVVATGWVTVTGVGTIEVRGERRSNETAVDVLDSVSAVDAVGAEVVRAPALARLWDTLPGPLRWVLAVKVAGLIGDVGNESLVDALKDGLRSLAAMLAASQISTAQPTGQVDVMPCHTPNAVVQIAAAQEPPELRAIVEREPTPAKPLQPLVMPDDAGKE